MESAPLLIDQQTAAEAASSPGWTMEPDEETNGSSGWTRNQNTPFFFLAQPPEGEVLDRIGYEVGEYRLIGTVKRTRTDELTFQNGQKTGQLTFYPDRLTEKYWNEAATPQHSINGRVVTINEDDPQYVLTVTYEFSALQFRCSPPVTSLAEGKSYKVAFDLHSKAGR